MRSRDSSEQLLLAGSDEIADRTDACGSGECSTDCLIEREVLDLLNERSIGHDSLLLVVLMIFMEYHHNGSVCLNLIETQCCFNAPLRTNRP